MRYHVIERVKDGASAGLELPTASHGVFWPSYEPLRTHPVGV